MQAGRARSGGPGSPVPSYGRVARLLHWLGLVLLFQFWLGWWMQGLPKTPPGLRAHWFNLHKSIGLVLGIYALLRLAWRLRVPVAPTTLPAWQAQAARANHGLLYLCMLVLPLSGYLGSSFSGYPVRFFGLLLPAWGWKWPAAKEALSVLHLWTSWLLAALVLMHVLAAVLHAVRRDGVLGRML